jgi:hypothetical protein
MRFFTSIALGLCAAVVLLGAGYSPLASVAHAEVRCGGKDGVKVTTPGLECKGEGNPIYDLLNFFINWVLRILTAVAVLIIVSAPVFMVASGGNPDMIKKAKSRLINAVVGLILLALAFVILREIGIAG